MSNPRAGIFLAVFVVLSGCILQLPWAPAEKVAHALYQHSGPATISLMTVVANDNNSAGHSSLLISGSQRVIYDPAGTWYHKDAPERADLLYGMNPKMLQYYIDYHARKRFRVIIQTKTVSREVADNLIQRAVENGASMSSMCANNTSRLLSQTPGFSGFPVSVWPKSAIEAMALVPGVSTEEVFQDDDGKDLKT